ncbi:MAG TPA: hypothetical protein VK756_08625 [Solirubrobacteraceae bacterium]|nr:hypothetical protein [Solirubrobacteraceae bacterium]
MISLIYTMCATTTANADVDMTGHLERVPSLKTSPGGISPLATSANGDYKCVDKYSVVANWYYYYALGNCKEGWEIDVVSYAPENSQTHEHSYGGFVTGAFSGCGWIDTAYPLEKQNSNKNSACGEGSGNEFKVAESSFMEKHNGGSTGDGYPVVNRTSCPEYANYRPWSSNNVEQELIRTAPAYASSGGGSNYPALKWRYTTKYSSTDGSGHYVMVRDDRVTGSGEANWVFVPRSCLPSSLPENENERVPSAPTVTSGGTSGVEPQAATLHGTVNPNTVETRYHFEYWTTGSPVSTPEGNAGSGSGNIEETAYISGLQPGTSYHYRLVATSATGTSTGGEAVFTTPSPPEASTSAASEIRPLQAQLNGNVDPKGSSTTYYFQYGKTTSYGSTTSEGNAGSGMTSVGENTTVILEPGTIYHYRIVAHNEYGTVEGGDQEFKTPGPVEAVTSAASGVMEEQAVLNGAINPRGYDAKYYFQYGKTTSYGLVTAESDAGSGSSSVPETATATKLAADTLYHYRLVGTSGGVTSYGADQQFTTQEEPSSSRSVAYNRSTGRIIAFLPRQQ